MIKQRLKVGALLWGLAGCSSGIELAYYQLPQPAADAAATSAVNAPVLYVEPLQVAAYLNANALILQQSAVQLHKTSQHQWAEPLDQQLQRLLVNGLQRALPAHRVIAQQSPAEAMRLLVQVEQFHGQHNGQVLISGRFHLLSGAQSRSQSFAVTLPQPAEGYPAMVETLGQGWQQAVGQFAAAVQQLTPQS